MKILDIASYLPEEIVGNDALVKEFGFDQNFIETKIGIKARHRAAPDEAASGMGIKAAEKLLSKTNTPPEDIGLLIVVTQNPDYSLPHVSGMIQSAIGLPKTVAAFDINLGCSGYVYALSVANGMMETLGIKYGMIITSDPYSKVIDPKDRATSPLFGDAAAATLLEASKDTCILGATFGTDGSGAENLIVKRGGALHRQLAPGDDPENFIYMNGRAIFNFMMMTVPKSVDATLEKAGLEKEDIDYFVFHQASKFMLESLFKRMKIPMDKVVIEVENTGNTVSSSIPIAIEKLMTYKPLAGKTVLISGFGVGLSWASAVIKL